MQATRIPVFESPHLACPDCGHHVIFGDGGCEGWMRIENAERLGCGCGGRYVYTPVAELYRRAGVEYCETMHRYLLTADCPRLDCWAKSCPLAETMAAIVAERLEVA